MKMSHRVAAHSYTIRDLLHFFVRYELNVRYRHARSSTILVFLDCFPKAHFSKHTPTLAAARYCRICTEFRDYSHFRRQSVQAVPSLFGH